MSFDVQITYSRKKLEIMTWLWPFDLWPALSPAKNNPKSAISNRIFLGKEGGDRALILHIWIAQWLKFFCTTVNIFWFRPSSGGSNLDQKCKLWVRPFSIKTQIIQKIFSQCFCLLEYYQQNWTISGRVKALKPDTIMYLHECVNQNPLKARNSVFWLNF